LIAVIVKVRGRDLAAGVTVDARVVDEEVARDILRQSPRSVSHVRPTVQLQFGRESALTLWRIF
jgi:hypothetical protein